jgi:hypothetical protein
MKYLKSLSCFDFQEYESRKKVKEFEARAYFNFREYGNSKGEVKRYDSGVYLDFVRAPFSEYWNFTEKEETPVVYNIPESWQALQKLPVFCLQVLQPNGANTKKHDIIQIIPIDGGWRRQYFSASKNWGKWVNIRDVLTKIQEDQNLQQFFMENWNSYNVIASYDARIVNGVSRIRRQRVSELTSLEELLNQIKNGTAKSTPNMVINTQLQYAQYFRKLRSAMKISSWHLLKIMSFQKTRGIKYLIFPAVPHFYQHGKKP